MSEPRLELQSCGSDTLRLPALLHALRARGVRCGVGELLGAHRALLAIDAASREDVRLALRSVLCASRAQIAAFDDAFVEVFGVAGAVDSPLVEMDELARLVLPRVALPGVAQAEVVEELVPAAWSAEEMLRTKDFAAYTDAELAAARRLLLRIARQSPLRPSRRTRPSRRRTREQDLRATWRASLRHGGEPLERRWRARSTRARPLVLVLDVSGSMAPYARALVTYLQAAVAARRRVEAFAFGTRLTRITHELGGRDPGRAVERAAAVVTDWSGGTRIGAALGELNRTHGRRLGRGADVVILSDGWDRGDPEELAAEMERLQRSAHRVIWLNPLAAAPGYEPLTRGMRAALPHADRLLPGNSIAALEALAEVLT